MSDFEKYMIDVLKSETRKDDTKLNSIESYLNHRLTKEEFINIANLIREIYITCKMRYIFIIKKIREYGLEPDVLGPLPYEFKLWEIFIKACEHSRNKYRSIFKDERVIEYVKYQELFKDELDFLNKLDIYSINENTDLEKLIPEHLKEMYNQVLQNKSELSKILRLYMTEKIRRLHLHKTKDKDKLDKPYIGPVDSREVIEEYNKIFAKELNYPLDVNLEYEKYRRVKFFFPELWEPFDIELDFQIAEEMFNDPIFLKKIICIWTGYGDEFDLNGDYYGFYISLSWLVSSEYNWLINRENSKENPDKKKIEKLQREAAERSERGMSPILLKCYTYDQVKRKAYEFHKAMQQQRQEGHTLTKKLAPQKNNENK